MMKRGNRPDAADDEAALMACISVATAASRAAIQAAREFEDKDFPHTDHLTLVLEYAKKVHELTDEWMRKYVSYAEQEQPPTG